MEKAATRRVAVVAGVLMIGSLTGCGGSDEPNPQLAERAATTRAAAGEAFPLVGEAVDAVGYFSSGGGRWAICGMEPSPSGAEYLAEIAIAQTGTGSSEHPVPSSRP